MNSAVGDIRQTFVVGNNDEGLVVFIPQVEKQLVQFFLILGIE